jgi:hypothetical protein
VSTTRHLSPIQRPFPFPLPNSLYSRGGRKEFKRVQPDEGASAVSDKGN